MFYEELYHILFNAANDALRAMEQENFGQARELLVRAQQTCEERYIARSCRPPRPEHPLWVRFAVPERRSGPLERRGFLAAGLTVP